MYTLCLKASLMSSRVVLMMNVCSPDYSSRMLKGWSIVLLNVQNILDFAEWDPNLVVELAKDH